MNQQTSVPKDLKLLSDFGTDVSILGMQTLKLRRKRVGVFVSELFFLQRANSVQYIDSPFAMLRTGFFEVFG